MFLSNRTHISKISRIEKRGHQPWRRREPLPEAAQLLIKESLGRVTLELFSPATGVVEADAQRLTTAKSNLREVELVGVTEHYERFLAELGRRYDWDVGAVPRKNVGAAGEVSSALRERIARDNALDMELYDLALSLAL